MELLINDIKKYRTEKEGKNQKALNMFRIIDKICKKELWRNKEYYSGSGESNDNIVLRTQMSFGDFIENYFSQTGHWYCSVKNILSLEDGKELFLKHGRSNMATYLNGSEKERAIMINDADIIIAAGKKCPNFNTIIRKYRPKQGSSTKPIQLNDKKEKALKKENDRLNKLVIKLQKENKALLKENDAFYSVFDGLKTRTK